MFTGHFYPIDRYPPFSGRLKPILLGELRQLLSSVDETYSVFTCQGYLVLMLASQITWVHTRPVPVSNDRDPKSFGSRVMLLLSGLLLRKDFFDLIAGVVVEKHTQLLHRPIEVTSYESARVTSSLSCISVLTANYD